MALKIVQKLIPTSKYPTKATYAMTPKFIVVHNTANDAPALNEVTYMTNNNLIVSFHYAVDDLQAVQGIPETRNAWHAGDGASGRGNRYGIAIEICYSKSGGAKFDKAEKNAAILIAQILKKYGWGLDKVTKHQDYSGKNCPHRTLALGWDRFLKLIELELKPALATTNHQITKNTWIKQEPSTLAPNFKQAIKGQVGGVTSATKVQGGFTWRYIIFKDTAGWIPDISLVKTNLPVTTFAPAVVVPDYQKMYTDKVVECSKLIDRIENEESGYLKQLRDRDWAIKTQKETIENLTKVVESYKRFDSLFALLDRMFPKKES